MSAYSTNIFQVVLFFHFLQLGQCCSKKVSAKIESKDEGMKPKRLHGNSSVTENIVFFYNETVTDNSHPQYDDCKINIDDLDLKWMPMFYSVNEKSFLMPTIDDDEISRNSIKRRRKRKENPRWLHIERSKNVIAMCPGTTFKGKTKRHQCLYCVGGKIMSDENICSNYSPSLSTKGIKLSSLSCTQSIKETIVSSDDKCGPPSGNGKIIQVGWTNEHINDASSFTPQITVCHDSFNENTYYTNHTLYGVSVQARDIGKYLRFDFKEGGKPFYTKSSAKTAYKISSQKTLFQRLLTNPDERSKIFSKYKYTQRYSRCQIFLNFLRYNKM